MLKQGFGAGKTTDDLSGFGTRAGGSFDTTQDQSSMFVKNETSMMGKTSKFGGFQDSLGPIQLPKINGQQQSPFKGFLDISVVT